MICPPNYRPPVYIVRRAIYKQLVRSLGARFASRHLRVFGKFGFREESKHTIASKEFATFGVKILPREK